MVLKKIVVADANFITRKGIEALINEYVDLTVVAEVADRQELEDSLKLHQPQLIVIDFASEQFKLEALTYIRKKNPAIQILAITTEIPSAIMAKALDAGVTSYVLKDCDKEEIKEALYKTMEGERFLCGKIVDKLMQASVNTEALSSVSVSCEGLNITQRELEIITLIAEGNSNKEIADKLFLSAHTVNTHRKNIMAKLSVNNTAGVVLYAVRENLLSPNKFLFS